MKYIIGLLILFLNVFTIYSQTDVRQIIKRMDSEIKNRNIYLAAKDSVISEQKNSLSLLSYDNYAENFRLNNIIYNLYKSFQYDSAYHYAYETLYWAEKLKDKDKELTAKGNILFCFISGGSFKEAAEIAENISICGVSSQARGEFYALCTRLYSDMYNYTRIERYRNTYMEKLLSYRDSVLALTSDTSYVHQEIQTLFGFELSVSERIAACEKLINNVSDNHRKAIITSNIAGLYLGEKDTLNAVKYLVESSVFDLKDAVMETTSKTELARCLYNMGYIKAANDYVHLALEEANFYNAVHRIVSINSILPIIKDSYLDIITSQRDDLKLFLILLSILSFSAISGGVLIFKQKQKLKMSEIAIRRQSDILKELHEIKDAYIWQALYAKSDYLDKTDIILKKVDKRLKLKQYSEIINIFSEFNLKEERKNLYCNFDRTFLMLFPSFVEEFNKLFDTNDRVVIEDGSLTAELRIFALIRLGITENDKIARFLNLSVNTIYAYKTKIKAKALVPKDGFDDYIMKIPKKTT